jgi:hypothetical protein
MSGITSQLNPCIRVVPEKLTVTQLLKRYPPFMDPGGYYVHRKRPLIKSHEPSSHPPYIPFLKIHFNIIVPLTPTSFKLPLPFKFLNQNSTYIYLYFSPVSLTHATCTTHILFEPLVRFGKECKLQSSKLCNFLQYLITSSPICSNIQCSTLFITPAE